MFQAFVMLFAPFMPGDFRQKLLRRLFGHEVHPTAQIGLNFISIEHLSLAEGAGIGSLNMIRGLSRLELHEEASIGRFNWITAIPKANTEFFTAYPDRDPSLVVKRASVILHRHIIDCNAKVEIGELGGIAGYRTTILTHGVDVRENVQTALPVTIGDRSMIGSNCVLLGGTVIPDRSVVGAGSSVSRAFTEPGLYGGVPAKRVADLPEDAKFFHRTTKMIY